ncbi:MAG: PH domain-containing protein [Tenuifilaceae bacterium]
MRKYRSKIGIGIVLFLLIIIGGTLALMIYLKLWFGVSIILVVIGLIGHLFLTTYYIIDGKNLIIKGGFIINKVIEIEKIKKISDSNSILSSPANSLDRIEISFNKYDNILISPKEKILFIDHLKTINPSIEVKIK